jgi:MFS family permease
MFGLYGVFQGVFRAVGKAIAADFAPAQLRASAIGWYLATVGVAGLIASLVAGLVWDRIDHAVVFLVGAGFAAAGALALVLMVPKQTRGAAA